MRIDDDLTDFVLKLARRKVAMCADRAATLADTFFQALDTLTTEARGACCEVNGEFLHVQLPEALQQLRLAEMPTFPLSQLHEDLKKHPAYVGSNQQYRGHFGDNVGTKNVRTWKFEAARVKA